MHEEPKRIDATGTIRRLQALVAIGFTQREIAEQLSLSPGHVNAVLHGAVSQVFPATAQRIAKRYRRLCWRPPTGPEADAQRRFALEQGWANPIAWDEIDDPRERPDGGAVLKPVEDEDEEGAPKKTPPPIDEIAVERAMRGEDVRLSVAERRVAITRLHARKWSDKKIAATLRVNERTVWRNRKLLKLDGWKHSELVKESA